MNKTNHGRSQPLAILCAAQQLRAGHLDPILTLETEKEPTRLLTGIRTMTLWEIVHLNCGSSRWTRHTFPVDRAAMLQRTVPAPRAGAVFAWARSTGFVRRAGCAGAAPCESSTRSKSADLRSDCRVAFMTAVVRIGAFATLHLRRDGDSGHDFRSTLGDPTPTDIFPNIGIPVISVVWSYTGLSPDDMAGRIIAPYERAFSTTVNDIEHIESQSLPGMGVVKIFFQPTVEHQRRTSAGHVAFRRPS